VFRFDVLLAVWALLALLLYLCWPRIAASTAWQAVSMVGVSCFAVVHMWVYSTLADDAFITFRYAQNLADGNGPVFNLGERVEGYSNFLWMVVLAALHAVFGANIVSTARLLGVACAVGALMVSYLLVRRTSGNGAAGVLAALVTASAGCFAAYGPAGLETPLFVLLVLCMLWCVTADRPLSSGVLGALAMMTRPDGTVVVAVFCLWFLALARRGGAGWRPLMRYVGGVLLLGGPYEIWRITYYGGYLLPNAVAAKDGGNLVWQVGTSGWSYFAEFFGAFAALLILVPVAVYLLAARRSVIPGPAVQQLWLVFGLAFVYMAFVVLTGGDWMPGWRMLIMPLAVLSCGVFSVAALFGGHVMEENAVRGRTVLLLATSVSVVLLAGTVTSNLLPRIQSWHHAVEGLSDVGTWFHNTLPAGTLVATYANGGLSYNAGPGIMMLDELGLTDQHIARHGYRYPTGTIGHLAYDYGYIVNTRKPEIVVTTGSGFSIQPDCGVPVPYQADYVGGAYQYVGHQDWMTLYLRKGLVKKLETNLARDSAFKLVACTAT
jgi:arabinofuranosyltransferase